MKSKGRSLESKNIKSALICDHFDHLTSVEKST